MNASSELTSDLRDATCVVVPAFNEGRSVGVVVQEIRREYRNVVVVDDGSTDDTYPVARRVATFVVRHAMNRGQGAALQTGIEFALRRGAKFIVTFDADGQHCVEDIATLLAPIHRGECEITLGSRFLGDTENMPPGRRHVLRLGVWFTHLTSGARLSDTHNGLRGFSRRAAEQIDLKLDRMAHASELIDQVVQSGLVFKEVPVRIRYTDYSLAKGQTSRGALRIAMDYFLGKVIG